MSQKKHKNEIISFKADESLLEDLEGVTNRSEFIRRAVTAALAQTCPLCSGSGRLTPSQLRHWQEFANNHRLVECDECHEDHLVCDHDPDDGEEHDDA